MLFARLVGHDRSRVHGQQRDRGRYSLVQRNRAEAPPEHQQLERAIAPMKTLFGRRNRTDLFTNRIAHPLHLRSVTAAERIGKSKQNAIGAVSQDPIGEPRDRVGVVNHQALGECDAHQRSGERREAAQAQHDVGHAPADHARALPEREEQRERPEQQPPEALAPHPDEMDRLEVEAVLRDELRLETFARPQPEYPPALGDQPCRNRQSREHVSPGAAGSNHDGAGHTVNPRSSLRFS